jgi:DNA polymerase elongation subunit (family B)
MLFETAWKEDYDFYKRVSDGSKSHKVKIDNKYEWYTERSSGMYKAMLDDNISLELNLSSNSKAGRTEYGFIDPIYRHIRDYHWVNKSYNKNPRVWYIDIETRSTQGFPKPEIASETVTLIQIYDSVTKTMYVLGLRDWVHQNDYEFDYTVKYINVKDEVSLFNAFFKLFKAFDPLIIYAWNGNGFDYGYLYNRAKKLGLDLNNFSNYGSVNLKVDEFNNKLSFVLDAPGHYYMDLLEIYKKFVFIEHPTYTLDYIASYELNESKVQHTEYAIFDDFYLGNYIIPTNPREDQLNSKIYKEAIKNGVNDEVRELAHSEFVYYGIKDTYLIKRIDEKQNFTALLLMLVEKMGVLLQDTLGTVKPWSQFISNSLHLDNKIMPKRTEFDQPVIVGGYVRDPDVGKHKWVISVDVNSMYPLLGMVGFNMSPETYIPVHKLPPELRHYILKYFNDSDESKRFDIVNEEWDIISNLLVKYNMSLAINGAVFSNDKIGMVPKMVQDIYNGRKIAKKTMLKYEERKLLIDNILKSKQNS